MRTRSYEPSETLPIGDLSLLSSFVCQLRLQDVPEAATRKAKSCVLDIIGSLLAGARSRAGAIARAFASRGAQEPEATLAGHPDRVLLQNAAWGNGLMASALDVDDGHRRATGHPGAVVVPAALAIAEFARASGHDVLEAVISGYETAIRIGAGLFSHTGVLSGSGHWASVGAAAACSKLLGLDAEKTRAALGIASTAAPVAAPKILRDGEDWPMTKECVGWGAMTGLTAALLAERGFSGPSLLRGIGKDVLCDLGETYRIEEVYFKPYPSCRWTHPPVDAALELKDRHDIDPSEIESVSVSTFARAAILSYPAPRTAESAQFSIPFTVAAALARGRLTVREMDESQLDDPDILRLAARVRIEHEEEFDALYPEAIAAKVTIHLVDGTSRSARVDVPRGNYKNPLSPEELLHKFHELAEYGMLDAERRETLAARVLGLEDVADVSEIMRCLAGRA